MVRILQSIFHLLFHFPYIKLLKMLLLDTGIFKDREKAWFLKIGFFILHFSVLYFFNNIFMLKELVQLPQPLFMAFCKEVIASFHPRLFNRLEKV